MNKRLVSLLLSALLLLGGFAVPGSAVAEDDDADVERIPIDSRAALAAIADDPDGDYILVADLDLNGEEWTPIAFSGTLDGDGHTIYNLRVRNTGAEVETTYDGNRKYYETVFGGLFSTVKDAEIRNLNLVNADLDVETSDNCFLGAIAGYALHSVIENCSVQTRVRLVLSGTNEGVGGIVGFSDENDFLSCTVDCELTFTDVNPDVDCEEFMGGVFSCGNGHVEFCTVKTRGYAEIYGYAHGGGVVGMIKLKKMDTSFRPRITDTTSDCEISFFEVAPSKRCYCDAFIGEDGAKECRLARNKTEHFEKQVSRTALRIRPDACPEPNEQRVITEPTCALWGYTTVTCLGCGRTYRDDYTPPAHKYKETVEPATCQHKGTVTHTCIFCGESYTESLPVTDHTPEWTIGKPAAVGATGIEEYRCTVCGTVLETRTIPALAAQEPAIVTEQIGIVAETVTVLVSDVAISPASVSLTVGEQAQLLGVVTPLDATDRTCVWSVDNPAVATVWQDGTVTGVASGTTTVRCACGGMTGVCLVTVSYSAWQWTRQYILFGWLWDK